MSGVVKIATGNKDKVPEEAAVSELNRWAEAWDLDLGFSDGEDQLGQKLSRDRLITAIRKGRLTVDEAGNLTLTLTYSDIEIKELKFSPPKGDAFTAADKPKESAGQLRMNAMLGAMTRTGPVVFTNLDGRDLKPCNAIASLFLVG